MVVVGMIEELREKAGLGKKQYPPPATPNPLIAVFRQRYYDELIPIAGPEAIWPYVSVAFVRIEPLSTAGQMVDTVEVEKEVGVMPF